MLYQNYCLQCPVLVINTGISFLLFREHIRKNAPKQVPETT
jgi:hypothetical protein